MRISEVTGKREDSGLYQFHNLIARWRRLLTEIELDYNEAVHSTSMDHDDLWYLLLSKETVID